MKNDCTPRARSADPPRLGRAQDPALPARPEDRDAGATLHEPRDLRRRARDVEHREGEPLGHVVRQLRVRAAREEHRLAVHVELRARRADRLHPVDAERRE